MIKLRTKVETWCLLIAVAGILGCHTFSRTQRGAAIGAGTGATVGGFIGKFAGNTALGAIIGGAVGGTAGEFIGRNMDKQATDIKLTVQGASVIRQGEGIIVKFDSGILFDPGKSNIKPDAQANLKNLASSLQKNPQTNVLIIGHTDNKEGTPESNMELSSQRADSVKVYLVGANVDMARLTAQGKGQAEPIADNSTDTGRTLNRRVEIVIVANNQMKSQATLNQSKP